MPSGAEPSLPSPVSPQSPPSQETPPVSPPPPLKITRTKTPAGILLGKYQLGRLLGRGSFAKVHEASSLEDDNTIVAVKIIDKTKTVDAAMEPRIIREVSAMRRLQHHPNILKIHEVMATKTKIYLVMELASGGELFSKVLRCGRLAEPAARRYFSQLISALHFCHENGVAHRDVKPQNLLLDQNGNLKVSDFGLSALPEQLNDGLLHTACGHRLIQLPRLFGEKATTVPRRTLGHAGEFQFPAWISKPAKAIIWQLLDPNPVTRMSLTRLMETSWFKRTLTKSSSNSQLVSLLHDSKLKHDMICNGVNAFDIISLSSGLDLSGLFKGGNDTRKEKRYITSSMEFDGVMKRIRGVGDRLGYRVEEGKRGVVGLGRGRVVVVVEVVQVADLFVLVEVKAVEGGGGGVEIEEEQWIDLEADLETFLFLGIVLL
ncbi:CBL-interacting serine/threonine-protein kinase 7 [Hibiscus syriacus]|uniref:non-specific serine/threonine protein kinase n=1 Tax=Hibiscus syriacus TaxID=106335 RepID=A0A6A2X8I5_HIBSY|nr:CBL-interacting serine/threonine-protein kinase 7 [Hibiscus syriacus]